MRGSTTDTYADTLLEEAHPMEVEKPAMEIEKPPSRKASFADQGMAPQEASLIVTQEIPHTSESQVSQVVVLLSTSLDPMLIISKRINRSRGIFFIFRIVSYYFITIMLWN